MYSLNSVVICLDSGVHLSLYDLADDTGRLICGFIRYLKSREQAGEKR